MRKLATGAALVVGLGAGLALAQVTGQPGPGPWTQYGWGYFSHEYSDTIDQGGKGVLGGPVASGQLPTTCADGTLIWNVDGGGLDGGAGEEICKANAWTPLTSGAGGSGGGGGGTPNDAGCYTWGTGAMLCDNHDGGINYTPDIAANEGGGFNILWPNTWYDAPAALSIQTGPSGAVSQPSTGLYISNNDDGGPKYGAYIDVWNQKPIADEIFRVDLEGNTFNGNAFVQSIGCAQGPCNGVSGNACWGGPASITGWDDLGTANQFTTSWWVTNSPSGAPWHDFLHMNHFDQNGGDALLNDRRFTWTDDGRYIWGIADGGAPQIWTTYTDAGMDAGLLATQPLQIRGGGSSPAIEFNNNVAQIDHSGDFNGANVCMDYPSDATCISATADAYSEVVPTTIKPFQVNSGTLEALEVGDTVCGNQQAICSLNGAVGINVTTYGEAYLAANGSTMFGCSGAASCVATLPVEGPSYSSAAGLGAFTPAANASSNSTLDMPSTKCVNFTTDGGTFVAAVCNYAGVANVIEAANFLEPTLQSGVTPNPTSDSVWGQAPDSGFLFAFQNGAMSTTARLRVTSGPGNIGLVIPMLVINGNMGAPNVRWHEEAGEICPSACALGAFTGTASPNIKTYFSAPPICTVSVGPNSGFITGNVTYTPVDGGWLSLTAGSSATNPAVTFNCIGPD